MTDAQNEANPRHWYEARLKGAQKERDHWAGIENRWTWVLLGSLVFGIAIWFFDLPGWVPLVGSGVALIAFMVGLKRNRAAIVERDAAERMMTIVREALERIGGQVVVVRGTQRPKPDPDSDERLLRPWPDHSTWQLTDQERDDFDFYAQPVGLFGLLNRTSSANGARRLRDMLEQPLLMRESIAARQECVRWLAEHDEARVALMAALAALRREDDRFAQLLSAVAQTEPAQHPVPSVAIRTWSIVSIIGSLALLTMIFTGSYGMLMPLAALLAANAIIDRRYRAESREYIAHWKYLAWSIQGLDIAVKATKVLPDETHLRLIKIASQTIAEQNVLKQLARWQSWSEAGGFVWEAVHAISFVQTLVAHNIRTAVLPNREALRRASGAIAELDALCSLACYAAEQPHRCWPELIDTGIEITDGVHPMLEPELAVPNRLTLEPDLRIWLISGSNMAGKSTFLRMIGANVLFAQLGTVALAKSFRWQPVRLISDLQARDNLGGEESYFLAEVRHVRRMVLPPVGTEPVLGLIDEPFRGTNSDDQSAASVAVVEHLESGGSYFVVASHDRHLPVLAQRQAIENFHFRENLGDGALVFDYKLHDGPAKTRNALRVLEFENYPETLVQRAHDWLKRHDRPDGVVLESDSEL